MKFQAVGLVAPSDIPYCGELEPSEEAAPVQEVCSSYSVPSSMAKVGSSYARIKLPIFSMNPSHSQKVPSSRAVHQGWNAAAAMRISP